MIKLPNEYEDEIKEILGAEFDAYKTSLEEESCFGLRYNTLKVSSSERLKLFPELAGDPVPWCADGYYYNGSKHYSKHPYYHCGLYYLQEPSAMVPASILPVEPGDRILDMCAAPGGKSTYLGAKLNGSGILITNDISASRAKALVKNLEFFGITNGVVMGEDPKKFISCFTGYFDKILIDAPCSGEGMFRREPGMIRNWVVKGPDYYSVVQKELVILGTKLLRPGGSMVYSTCTFSKKENEQVIEHLLANTYDMEHVKSVRMWPQRVRGEGHFAALLHKAGKPSDTDAVGYRVKRPNDLQVFYDFTVHTGITREWDESRFDQVGERLFYIPLGLPVVSGMRILLNGWYLGEIKKKRFEPSGAFARGLYPGECGNLLNFQLEDERVLKYLKCETIEVDENLENGWYLVCLDKYPMGWGKVNQGTLKNKYPAGWRWQ